MNNNILDFIAQETQGTAIRCQRYSFEAVSMPRIEYDRDIGEFGARDKVFAETSPKILANGICLKSKADELLAMGRSYCFNRFFLDGTRRTYKIGDIRYSNRIYPVIAGQTVVGYCERYNGDIIDNDYRHDIVVCLPEVIEDNAPLDVSLFISDLVAKVNKKLTSRWNGNLKLSAILPYKTQLNEHEKLEDKAISKIHDFMLNREKELVNELVKQDRLSKTDGYLLKDGSIEYKQPEVARKNTYSDSIYIKSNYQNVIGVSKSFNPERVKGKNGKTDHTIISKLAPYCRTPVYRYNSYHTGGTEFGVWYVRIRQSTHNFQSPFDGVLKLEKVLITDEELQYGIDSEEVDTITATIINERNPVCYASDSRWSNHVYPMHLTERFLKNKLINTNIFMNIF